MKSLNTYILESAEDGKNGHWEEFVDEDTGEIIKIWKDDPDPEKVKQETEKFMAIVKTWSEKEEQILAKLRPINKELDKLYNEKDEAEDGLRNAKRELRDLRIDMEEEIGQVIGDDAEMDRLGNEYGEKMNELEEEISKWSKKLKELEPKIDPVETKYWKLKDQLRDAQDNIWWAKRCQNKPY